MARKDLKSALSAILDQAYSAGSPMAEAASAMAIPAITPTEPPPPAPENIAAPINTEIKKQPSSAQPPAGEPTNDQAHYPDNEPVNKPDNDKVNQSTNKPVSEPDTYPDSDPAVAGAATDQSANEPAQHRDNKPVSYPVNDSGNEGTNKPAHSPVNYSVREPVNYPTKPVDPELWFPFTEKQGQVLLYLIKAGGCANRQNISDDTGVNIATVKHTLRILSREGYVTGIKLYVNHSQRGFTYQINRHLCDEFYARLTGQPVNYPANEPAGYPANRPIQQPTYNPVNKPVDSPLAPISSSRNNQTTTTGNHQVLTGPESFYWLDTGLDERRCQTWLSEFGLTPEDLRVQLCWCRFDLIENGKEETVENPISWFYGILRRSGGSYARPANYRTPQEIRAEQMKRDQEAVAAAERELADLETQSLFDSILANPDGEDYQELLAGLNEFERNGSGRILATGLRRVFNERRGLAS